MDFWGMVEKGVEKATEYRDNYEDSYGRCSDKYSNMSNSELKREIQHVTSSNGLDAKSLGRRKALEDEINNRRNR